MEIRRKAKYTKLAKKVIKETPELAYIKESGVRIAFLACDVEKKKGGSIVYGDCKKVDPRYKWCCPFDFLITIYEPNVALFDRQQIEILLRHEMRHIGINPDGVDEAFTLVNHDIEDFRSIIDDYGLDWAYTG